MRAFAALPLLGAQPGLLQFLPLSYLLLLYQICSGARGKAIMQTMCCESPISLAMSLPHFKQLRHLSCLSACTRAESALRVAAGCVFVHASGFIGGNATREGVLAMARRALKEN